MSTLSTWLQRAGLIVATIFLALFVGSQAKRHFTVEIVEATPSDLAVGVAPNAHLTVTFSSEMNSATLTPATIQLLDNHQNLVPCRLSYNARARAVTLDAASPLAYGTNYQLRVEDGKRGVQDSSGSRLHEPFISNFTTAWAPTTGPGGPILVITAKANPFTTYYPEILRAEGLNEFSVADLSQVSPAILSKYQLVLLGDMPLGAGQVAELTDWVNGGGKLIAMHPDAQLADLLGLDFQNFSVGDGYFAIDPANPIGAGLVHGAIQYHGSAEQFSLHGAVPLAALYRDAATELPSPAVSLHEVGAHGGMAGAFAFDLAKSVIQIRQGNPAWAGQKRTGAVWGDWTLTADMFCGPASFDPQKSWVDMNNLAIPQADEAQRLLANMIVRMNLPNSPLPRFWYFPNGARAVVLLSGDDHNGGGTLGRFRHIQSSGTSAELPMTASSYLFPGDASSDANLSSFASMGFESALHFEVTAGSLFGNSSDVPADWTSRSQLDYLMASELFTFNQAYPSLANSRTTRTHGPVWSDYDSLPQVEFAHGIRLDASYYFAPPQWVQNRPGLFTGSGIPMRFATAEGTPIDVYQAATQITDESGQAEPMTINTLLDNATGPKEFFAAITVNAHDDDVRSPLADQVMTWAREHNAPVMSAQSLLDFEDGRGNSSFADIIFSPAAGTLTFTINQSFNASHLMAMIPATTAGGEQLTGIQIDGQAIALQMQHINGIDWATFPAAGGRVVVHYALPNP